MLHNFQVESRGVKACAACHNEMRQTVPERGKVELIQCAPCKRKRFTLINSHASSSIRKSTETIETFIIKSRRFSMWFENGITVFYLRAGYHAAQQCTAALIFDHTGNPVDQP